jgi:GNAT superfamily N-acetyltransferase
MTSYDFFSPPKDTHADVAQEIETCLLSSLAQLNTQSTNTIVVLVKRDRSGRLIAGVSGSTSYGWLLVKLLWVTETARGQGLGRDLMQAAEERALELGCHGIWLDTSNPLARQFYLGIGYTDFGVLKNDEDHTPPDHCRWFMKKML